MAATKPIVIPPDAGRQYTMGRISAVFKADGDETQSKYSISEWWLDANTAGPGAHEHPEDHIFYVIQGTVSMIVAGEWFHAERGSYALIPGGTPHDFENRGSERCGFISLNAPGGFEDQMAMIVPYLKEHPVGDASSSD